jgi:carbon monoxide dehydrogenase subunit G
MKLEGNYLFEAPVEEVWKALLDPVVLAAVMPGCEKLVLVDGQYVGELNIKVGPVQGKFSGKVDLKDLQEPKSYTMSVDGRGAPGFVRATALVRLEREGGKTRMHYDADAQIGGKIASVGQRLLEASSRAITKTSLEGLNENIKIRAAAAATTAAPPEPNTVGADVAPKQEFGEKEGGSIAKAAEAPTATAAPEAPASAAPPAIARPVVLKPIDQKALAAAVAKEVSKTLLPMPVWIVIGLGVLIAIVWFLVRR